MIWLAGEIWVLLMVAFGLGAACAVFALDAKARADTNGDEAADGQPIVRASAPHLLLDRPNGQKDDLTQIIGIDAETEAKLNELGIFHFGQIASWSDAEGRWIEIRLNEPGRILRERWTEQAAAIA